MTGAGVLIHGLYDAESATLDQVAVLRGHINIVSIAGRSLGYPLGGLLADTIGWRWYVHDDLPLQGISGTEHQPGHLPGKCPLQCYAVS